MVILALVLISLAMVIYSFAWIPAIIAIIYFALKRDLDKKSKIIRIAIAAAIVITSLMTFGSINPESEATDQNNTTETELAEESAESTMEVTPEPIRKITPTATPEISAEGNLNIHFLDVNQGTSVLLESDGHYAIYDGGNSDRSSFVVAYLKDQGIEKLDYVIASHYDADHISGLVGVLNVFDVDTILGPNYVEDTEIYNSFMNMISSKNKSITYSYAGDVYTLGSTTLEVIAPVDIDTDPNECSIVLRVNCGEKTLLLTGDAGSESETAMIATADNLSADILVAGHHGSADSTSDVFLDEVAPEYVVISCGKDNSYGHPTAETMNRIESRGISIFRTDLQGTILASIDSNEITWNIEPSTDYSSGDLISSESETVPIDANENSADEQTNDEESSGTSYVLNTNTKKFHYPSCSSVNSMKDHNRSDFTGSRDDVINMGYDPCGRCHP